MSSSSATPPGGDAHFRLHHLSPSFTGPSPTGDPRASFRGPFLPGVPLTLRAVLGQHPPSDAHLQAQFQRDAQQRGVGRRTGRGGRFAGVLRQLEQQGGRVDVLLDGAQYRMQPLGVPWGGRREGGTVGTAGTSPCCCPTCSRRSLHQVHTCEEAGAAGSGSEKIQTPLGTLSRLLYPPTRQEKATKGPLIVKGSDSGPRTPGFNPCPTIH